MTRPPLDPQTGLLMQAIGHLIDARLAQGARFAANRLVQDMMNAGLATIHDLPDASGVELRLMGITARARNPEALLRNWQSAALDRLAGVAA